MSVSRFAGVGAAIWALPTTVWADGFADPGRLDLMAAEAATFGAPVTEMGEMPWMLVSAVIVGTLVAGWVGTRIALRTSSLGRVREKDGWREITYRFRSNAPMKVGRDLFPRLEGLVSELEDLGAKVRGAASPEPMPVPAAPIEPVTFRRRDEPTLDRGPDTYSGSTAGMAEPAETLAVPRHESETGPEIPIEVEAENKTGASDREGAYRKARSLLAAGHDLRKVREMTGLKTAEIDLLRACPGKESPRAAFRVGRAHLNVGRFGAGEADGEKGNR